jgi:hypothetical protein
LSVLELALKSDELQLASENDAYALVGGWLAGQDEDEDDYRAEQRDLERLVKCLRLHHMSAAFLTSVVSFSDYRHDWPGLMELCTSALMYQSIASTLPSLNIKKSSFPCKPRRSPAAFEYGFEAQVRLAECSEIKRRRHQTLAMRLGVADGYLLDLILKRRLAKAGGEATVGLGLRLRRPNTTAKAYNDGDTVLLTGPIVRWQITVNGDDARSFRYLFGADDTFRGSSDYFRKSWEEVVREDSGYFPKGRMTVKVRATFLSDRHEECVDPFLDEDDDHEQDEEEEEEEEEEDDEKEDEEEEEDDEDDDASSSSSSSSSSDDED